jgi:hypothetical protein
MNLFEIFRVPMGGFIGYKKDIASGISSDYLISTKGETEDVIF